MAPRKPRDVRHHESDEPDHTGDRDSRGGEQRCRQIDPTLHALDVGAEIARGLFPQGEEVERPGRSEQHSQWDGA